MANRSKIMGLHGLKNKTKVNHFDQSHRSLFTAKCGELLPVYFNILNPGDEIKIDASSFTRTQPLQQAAFTRLRENIQFFAVPYSTIWRYFPDVIKNMPTDIFGNSTSRFAVNPDNVTDDDMDYNTKLYSKLPTVDLLTLHKCIGDAAQNVKNSMGNSKTLTEYANSFSYAQRLNKPSIFLNGEFRFQSCTKL